MRVVEFRTGSWFAVWFFVALLLLFGIFAYREGDVFFATLFGAGFVVLLYLAVRAFWDERKNDPVVLKGTLFSFEHNGRGMKGYILNEANEISEFSFERRHDELFQLLLRQPIELTIARRSKILIKCVVFDKKGT